MWLNDYKIKKRPAGHIEPPAKRLLQRRHTPLQEPDNEFAMCGADFRRGGEALQKFALHAVRKAIRTLGRPHGNRILNVGSLCTGSAGDAVALDTLQTALETESIDITFEHIFYCEKVENKRDRWCKKVHSVIAGTEVEALLPCAFTDCEQLGTPSARCTMHTKKHAECTCTLPSHLCLLIAGISCKDFSRANMNKGQYSQGNTGIFNAQHTPGGSAQTMHAVLALVSKINIEALLLENSDELAGNIHSPSLDEFLSALGAKGYDCHAFVMNSSTYAVPQERKHIYIFAVKRPNKSFNIQSGESFYKGVETFLKACRTVGPDFTSCLLDEKDETVQKFLAHRTSKESKGWETKTMATHRDKWMKATGQNMGYFQVSTADSQSPWYRTLAAREKDLLAWHQYKTAGTDTTAESRRKATDLHQSIDQFTWAACGPNDKVHVPTILPQAKLWVSCEQHRMLTGAESLAFQGWPIYDPRFAELLQNESNNNQQDLAGNAFPTTCIVACVVAIIFAGDVKEEGDTSISSTAADVQRALQLMRHSNN